MGAGSGVDVASLAQNLVDAEGAPQKNAINAKITKNEARISGYSAMSFVLSQVNTAMTALKDQSSFNTLSASNTNTSAFDVTPSTSAATGTHDIEVLRMARAQRTVSNGISSPTLSLNNNAAMKVSVYVGAKPTVSVLEGKDPVTESSTVQFRALADKESITIAGVTYTSVGQSTASQVASAFASLANGDTPQSTANGNLTGNLTGFSTGAANTDTVTFTSSTVNSNVTDLVVPPSGVNAISTTQGITPTRQTATVSFTPLLAGQSVTVAGLTYTATSATSASEVATAFAGLAGNATSSTTAPKGTISGTLSGFSAGLVDSNNPTKLVFTSTTSGNTPAFVLGSGAPKLTVAAGQDTPQGIVNAINAANNGVTAQLVNTGDGSQNPFQIILTGQQGASNVFSFSTDDGNGNPVSGVTFDPNNATNQTASDAKVKVDGITYVRTNNALTDVVPGLTLSLKGVTTSPASVTLTRDNTPIKDKITALVSSYNDAVSIFKEVSDPKSTLPTYGATLVGDSTVRAIKQQLRGMFTGSSSTPGTSVSALWQLGISLDQSGVMSVDATKLDSALTNNYDDVVKTFTGNKNGISALST